MKELSYAVVGATGAVGREFLNLLLQAGVSAAQIRAVASPRSAGTTLPYGDQPLTIQALSAELFQGMDVAVFSAGADLSRQWIPIARNAGAYVVDNSSAFRMDPEIPLVVPEINFDAVTRSSRIISVPNCSVILLLMALYPIEQLQKIERVIVSTYQSASGGGAALMQDLLDQTQDYLNSRTANPKVSPHPYAFNLFSHNTAIGADGFNGEEAKMMQEARKILGRPDLRINATCVRVPVLRAHSESVTIEFAGPAPELHEIRKAFDQFSGVRLVDDQENNEFPMPILASGQGDVLVGRLRVDPSHPHSISLFLSGDQLLKGAALNAFQIVERCFASGMLKGAQ